MSSDSHYIDLLAVIAAQRQERYRALLILAERARERSQQARQLMKRLDDAYYLNLLDTSKRAQTSARGLTVSTSTSWSTSCSAWTYRRRSSWWTPSISCSIPGPRRGGRISSGSCLVKRLDTYERGAKTFVFFALEDVYLRQHELETSKDQPRIFLSA